MQSWEGAVEVVAGTAGMPTKEMLRTRQTGQSQVNEAEQLRTVNLTGYKVAQEHDILNCLLLMRGSRSMISSMKGKGTDWLRIPSVRNGLETSGSVDYVPVGKGTRWCNQTQEQISQA